MFLFSLCVAGTINSLKPCHISLMKRLSSVYGRDQKRKGVYFLSIYIHIFSSSIYYVYFYCIFHLIFDLKTTHMHTTRTDRMARVVLKQLMRIPLISMHRHTCTPQFPIYIILIHSIFPYLNIVYTRCVCVYTT